MNNNLPKTIIYVALAILVVVGLFYAAAHRKSGPAPTKQELAQMTPEQKKAALEEQVKDLESQAKSLTKGVGDQADKDYDIAKSRIYIKLAEALNGLDRHQDAVDALNNIPESQKSTPAVNKAFAIAYNELGQKDKAAGYIKAVLADDPTDAEAWVINLELNSDLPKEQLNNLYREAIAKTKSNVDVMISYAHFSEKIGDKATAIAAWETARNVDPNNASKYEVEMARLR